MFKTKLKEGYKNVYKRNIPSLDAEIQSNDIYEYRTPHNVNFQNVFETPKQNSINDNNEK